jgi:hypothetical protein
VTDERDRYRAKTPPLGSPSGEIRKQLDASAAARERSETPVGMQVIGDRTKSITADTIDIRQRLHVVEREQLEQTRVLAALGGQMIHLDTKVDLLVDESKQTRRERESREARADKRAETELAFRRDRALKIIAIVVPTIAAVGALIATIVSSVGR